MKHDSVTWLDFRADDLSQARDFIRSLQEDGVIDELGFLALLRHFSDLLRPATTTLMRSARYFYFVSRIYRLLERDGVRASHVSNLARQRQDELKDVIAGKETVGVIGRDAGINLRQFPSLIYWNGLRKLGMFTSRFPDSLLSHMLTHRLIGIDWPWDCRLPVLPPAGRVQLICRQDRVA